MRLRIVVSLPNDNEFQHHQAAVERSAAMRLGVDVELFHAEDDAITQSEQLLNVVQFAKSRPDAIIAAPVSKTGLQNAAGLASDKAA